MNPYQVPIYYLQSGISIPNYTSPGTSNGSGGSIPILDSIMGLNRGLNVPAIYNIGTPTIPLLPGQQYSGHQNSYPQNNSYGYGTPVLGQGSPLSFLGTNHGVNNMTMNVQTIDSLTKPMEIPVNRKNFGTVSLFSGTSLEDIDYWLKEYESTTQILGWNDQEKAKHVVGYLRNTALDFYRSL